MLGRLPLEPLLGARFDLGTGLGELRQSVLAARQLVGDRHAVDLRGRIRGFGPGHQLGHLGLQLRLDLAGMLVGQRAVPAEGPPSCLQRRPAAATPVADRHPLQLKNPTQFRLIDKPLTRLEISLHVTGRSVFG